MAATGHTSFCQYGATCRHHPDPLRQVRNHLQLQRKRFSDYEKKCGVCMDEEAVVVLMLCRHMCATPVLIGERNVRDVVYESMNASEYTTSYKYKRLD